VPYLRQFLLQNVPAHVMSDVAARGHITFNIYIDIIVGPQTKSIVVTCYPHEYILIVDAEESDAFLSRKLPEGHYGAP